ncbi:NYN domain-containing protein [Candidatus Uhrbacteria bacterium]|nr:NYN domain-containing protein [Candidatus Uhrbacteria bacterium]
MPSFFARWMARLRRPSSALTPDPMWFVGLPIPRPDVVPPPAAPASVVEPTALRPRVVLVLDLENIMLTCSRAGARFDPVAIRERAQHVGDIALAFACGNYEAIPAGIRQRLTLSGFPLLHFERLGNGTVARKDVVDANLHDLVRRILDCAPGMDGVVLVTDDQDFAPLITAIRDRGKRCIVLSPRRGSALARITEVVDLPLTLRAREPVNPLWNPEEAILTLCEVAAAPEETTQREASTRLQLRSPLPARILRNTVRMYRRKHRGAASSFFGLMECARTSASAKELASLPDDAVRGFLEACIASGVLLQFEVKTDEGPRPRYRPNWNHPFCRDAIADIVVAEEGGASATASEPDAPVLMPVAATGS